MAHFLGLGLTHYPLLAGTDEHMADLLRWTLTDPDIPTDAKDPANWAASMRSEWGADGGVASAARHRKMLVANLSRCRDALEEFAPDVVVVWGDDQYENFREEVIPPFCVLAYGDVDVHPFELMTRRGSPNAWGLPDTTTITLHGEPEGARRLTDDLIGRASTWPTPTGSAATLPSRTRSSIPNCSWTIPTPGRVSPTESSPSRSTATGSMRLPAEAV